MKKSVKHLSLRIDGELLRWFDYVAQYDDRSMNSLLLRLVRGCVDDFEKAHGRIVLPEDSDPSV